MSIYEPHQHARRLKQYSLNINSKTTVTVTPMQSFARVFCHHMLRLRRVAVVRNWSEVVASPSERSWRLSSWSPRSKSRPTLSRITSVTSAICTLTLSSSIVKIKALHIHAEKKGTWEIIINIDTAVGYPVINVYAIQASGWLLLQECWDMKNMHWCHNSYLFHGRLAK